ncbi:hypothetical protein BGW37DRAFT_419833 [Umbelopsis sp. PMI_123]|nr:hypothetical protein BGW37DRAFT_419833 [Umbelopsis sp. PMI_123]
MSRRAGIDSQTDRVQQWRLQSSEDIIEEDEFDFDEEDDDEEDDRIIELDDDLRSSMTSSPSIPDSDIDFDLVYALHTFVATVDGQASVVKGDALTLLDDANSYWWLVKVLKTGEIGYIPAENIETPFERLARLNKHRNVEISNQSSTLPSGEKKNGLKRFFSLGKKPKSELPLRRSATISIRDDDLETNWSTSVSSSIDDSQQDDASLSLSRQTSIASESSTQVTVLRVFAGNVNVGTNYKTVVVDSNTNAEDLIKRAVSRFHIHQIEGNNVDSPNSRVEYYLSVKTMDGDELTLTPQDKPLSIFQSLTAHLTTPLPSLTHVKQLRENSSTVEDSVIRFYLHKRIKRVHEREGQLYIKISVYADDDSGSSLQNKKTSNKSSIIKSKKKNSDQSSSKYRERIDKLIAVGSNATVAEVTLIALEKFHILNGVGDGVEDDEADRALITSFSKDLDHYRLMVVRHAHGKFF